MTAIEYIRASPQRFNPEAMSGAETCFHFSIFGEKGGELTVNIKDGHCNVQDGLHGSPKCFVQATDDTYMGIINGKLNGSIAYMQGKLRISDMAENMRFSKLFWS